jgi:hypothetical protein
MNVFIIIINEKIFTFHHTIRQTCLTCLHLSVLCTYNLQNDYNTLVPYNGKFNDDKLKN